MEQREIQGLKIYSTAQSTIPDSELQDNTAGIFHEDGLNPNGELAMFVGTKAKIRIYDIFSLLFLVSVLFFLITN